MSVEEITLSQPPVISVHNLFKTYRLGLGKKIVEALRGVSFDVYRGEIFAFLGPNGAGKTTTIKILLDHARADSGQAYLMGIPVRSPKARQKVGYLPDLPNYYRFLTARELLEYFGRLHKIPSPERERRIKELLSLVGLEGREDEPLKGFSRGMLQRLGMAQALIGDPELLILDEPLGGLDPIGRYHLRSLILDLQSQGKTIFFSSHILEDAERLADRVAIIHKGKVRAIGTLNELLQSQPGWEVEFYAVNDSFVKDLERRILIKKGMFPQEPGAVHRDQRGNLKLHLPDQESLTWFLQACEKGYLHIISLNPRRITLEEAFLAELQNE